MVKAIVLPLFIGMAVGAQDWCFAYYRRGWPRARTRYSYCAKKRASPHAGGHGAVAAAH
jgi:hypothetical protein